MLRIVLLYSSGASRSKISSALAISGNIHLSRQQAVSDSPPSITDNNLVKHKPVRQQVVDVDVVGLYFACSTVTVSTSKTPASQHFRRAT